MRQGRVTIINRLLNRMLFSADARMTVGDHVTSTLDCGGPRDVYPRLWGTP